MNEKVLTEWGAIYIISASDRVSQENLYVSCSLTCVKDLVYQCVCFLATPSIVQCYLTKLAASILWGYVIHVTERAAQSKYRQADISSTLHTRVSGV